MAKNNTLLEQFVSLHSYSLLVIIDGSGVETGQPGQLALSTGQVVN